MVSVEWFGTIFVIFFQHYENVKKRYVPFYAALAEAKSYVKKKIIIKLSLVEACTQSNLVLIFNAFKLVC